MCIAISFNAYDVQLHHVQAIITTAIAFQYESNVDKKKTSIKNNDTTNIDCIPNTGHHHHHWSCELLSSESAFYYDYYCYYYHHHHHQPATLHSEYWIKDK